MPNVDPADFAAVEPKEFAQLIRSTPDAKIAEVLGSESRGPILDAIFERMPTLFRPDRAGDLRAVMHWVIRGRPDGGSDTYELLVDGKSCKVTKGADQTPTLSLTMGPVDFIKLVSGNANPVVMFMTGKLKAKGDLSLAANIASLFDIPKA